MTNTNLQQKDYTLGGRTYQLKLPFEYDVIIPCDDSVRLLDRIVGRMDLGELYAEYSELGRKPAVTPGNMFKIMLYAYMDGVYSSRKIESSCNRDVNYMWLLDGESAPDHNTINRFRKDRLGEVVETLFYRFVGILCEMGEVKFENVFQDGTKMEADAGRYTYVWKKAVEKNEMKMHGKANLIAGEIGRLHGREFRVNPDSADADMYRMVKFLKQKMAEGDIEWVSQKGGRKSNEQKMITALEEYRLRQAGYEQKKDTAGERGSYSKTDPDATFMRMKDDHMQSGQLKPAYNVQLAVEGEYVIGAGLFPDANDLGTLKPTIENMSRHLPGMKITNMTLDAGYESEENYVYLDGMGIKYFIKPTNFEQSKKAGYKNDINRRENMDYSPEKDEYTCANGRRLPCVGTAKRKSKTGYETEITIYECESCEGCPVKEKCTKAKGNRRLEVSKVFQSKRAVSLENITSEQGIRLRVNRWIQSEGAFGVLKQDRGFTRFLTRGTPNVKTETLLLCLGYNINKLHAKIQGDRCGKDLHDVKVA